MIPSPDILAIALLRTDPHLAMLHGERVSVQALPGPTAVRVTLMPGVRQYSTWEWSAQIQVDVWADDQLDAAQLAAAIRHRWPYKRGRVADGFVSGTWIAADPTALTDASSTRARYTMTLGLAAHADTGSSHGSD